MKPWPLIFAVPLLLSACSKWGDPKAERAERAAKASGNIQIGAVWPWQAENRDAWQGIELAVAEINAKGGVLNRQLQIVKKDDEASLARGRLVAQEFADNMDLVAVIGHLDSFIAAPASAIYHDAGLLYMTPGATTSEINRHGYRLTFRAIPTDTSIGRRMAEAMAEKGERRVAILYAKDDDSQDIANAFEQRARELGLGIADRRSFNRGSREFGVILDTWKSLYEFDAMLIAGSEQDIGRILSQARQLNVNKHVFIGREMEAKILQELAGPGAEGVFMPNFVGAEKNGERYKKFVELFERRYGRRVISGYAVESYDAVHLLAQAMTRANSTVPENVAVSLRSTKKQQGAAGEYTFDETGNIPGKKIWIQQYLNGGLVFVN
ncbi:MAG: ABC transporter substrate-binding protein [Pseudomonadota bacterium]